MWATVFGNHDDMTFERPPEWFSPDGVPPRRSARWSPPQRPTRRPPPRLLTVTPAQGHGIHGLACGRSSNSHSGRARVRRLHDISTRGGLHLAEAYDFEDLESMVEEIAREIKTKKMFIYVDTAEENLAKPFLTLYGLQSEKSLFGILGETDSPELQEAPLLFCESEVADKGF
ncbi:Protein disulfide isomerase-like 1-5 [Zea mays]|uniref:Protein disulfide isomerase-like 1-5 n=1 Tax=Zea mays TaxID=4577 RepID=A0A3L6F623_MAIZE|nr:Protein disulfide isomerase-like 1-5 [Zea mays]